MSRKEGTEKELYKEIDTYVGKFRLILVLSVGFHFLQLHNVDVIKKLVYVLIVFIIDNMKLS